MTLLEFHNICVDYVKDRVLLLRFEYGFDAVNLNSSGNTVFTIDEDGNQLPAMFPCMALEPFNGSIAVRSSDALDSSTYQIGFFDT